MTVSLIKVATDEDWIAFHTIRRAELFEPRGRAYDPSHPDDRSSAHSPMVLKFGADCLGVIRIDHLGLPQVAFRLVAIRRDCQRQGYGRQLMDLASDYARKAGAVEAVLNSSLDAVEFYRSTGFHAFAWDDPWYTPGDNVQMRRALTCG